MKVEISGSLNQPKVEYAGTPPTSTSSPSARSSLA